MNEPPAIEIPISGTQRFYGRLAGWMYLLNYATAVSGVMIESSIRGSGDFAEKARRIVASEHLYRVALASMAISWAVLVVQAFALYVTFESVNKRLAQLALYFELGEAFIGGATVVLAFASLRLYTGGTGALHSDQLQALIAANGSAYNSGFAIAMVFFAVASMLFFFLFYQSAYIPRGLAALGVFGSALMAAVSVAMLIFPEQVARLQLGWAPIGIAEVATALWLVTVGIRPPRERAGV